MQEGNENPSFFEPKVTNTAASWLRRHRQNAELIQIYKYLRRSTCIFCRNIV